MYSRTTPSNSNGPRQTNQSLDEDEALARALAAESTPPKPSLFQRFWGNLTSPLFRPDPPPPTTNLKWEDDDAVIIDAPGGATNPIVINDGVIASVAQELADEELARKLQEEEEKQLSYRPPPTPRTGSSYPSPNTSGRTSASPRTATPQINLTHTRLFSNSPTSRPLFYERQPHTDDDELITLDQPPRPPSPQTEAILSDEALARELQQQYDLETSSTSLGQSRTSRPSSRPSSRPASRDLTQEARDALLAARLQAREFAAPLDLVDDTADTSSRPLRRSGSRITYRRRYPPPDLPTDDNPDGIDLSTYEGRLRLDEFAIKVGLTKEQLAALPIVKFNGSSDEKMCTICMTDFEVGESVTVLPCLHKFHGSCITPWLVQNKICPVCKLEVKV